VVSRKSALHRAHTCTSRVADVWAFVLLTNVRVPVGWPYLAARGSNRFGQLGIEDGASKPSQLVPARVTVALPSSYHAAAATTSVSTQRDMEKWLVIADVHAGYCHRYAALG
jgi:hypothetical protein